LFRKYGRKTGKKEKEPYLLPCEYRFHEHCIAQWLHNHNTCPNCRTVVDVEHVEVVDVPNEEMSVLLKRVAKYTTVVIVTIIVLAFAKIL
jgi:hypothetical protein